jgi:hypothetical protein
VGQSVDLLRAIGARVFHDVLADVVSEGGIFVIETKKLTKLDSESRIRVEAGQVYRDGFPVHPNPIRQATAEVSWLQKLILKSTAKECSVRPVVLFPGWWVERMDKATKDIAWVLPDTAYRTSEIVGLRIQKTILR